MVLRVWDDAAVSNARPLEQFLDVPVPVARRVGVEFVEVVVVGLDVLPVCWAVVAPVLSVDPLPPTRFAGARVVLDEFRAFEAVSVPGAPATIAKRRIRQIACSSLERSLGGRGWLVAPRSTCAVRPWISLRVLCPRLSLSTSSPIIVSLAYCSSRATIVFLDDLSNGKV